MTTKSSVGLTEVRGAATRSERISEVLRGLTRGTPEIIGATLVSSDGFIVASVLPNEVDEDMIGGMAASLLSVSERIAVDLLESQMEQTYIRALKGFIVLNACGPEAMLVLLVTRDAKLGLIFLELKRTVAELIRVL
jgi:predicted regulator of Ras-like GTPase activity (Roadblock/LC7/MglB family)